MKWEAVSREPGPPYVVVNADEGEPGTIKDRYVMELRPHLMVEATVLAMRSLDATEGHIYLREEYATSRARLQQALDEFRAAGLLDGLSLELVVGAGAYIAGEETAMLESMEGRRAMPRLKPPFPSQVGYLGRPTLIQNVETLAHIPAILRNGGEWWAGARNARAHGDTSLVGHGRRREARLLRGAERRDDARARRGVRGRIHGRGRRSRPGRRSERHPPAVPHSTRRSRGTASREYGAGPGSAAVQVFPTSYSPLRLLAETMRFFAEESCQKCTPCRIGNRALHHLAEELEHERGGDVAREGRRVAARDGEDVDLRARPGVAVPGAQRDDALARALRAARHVNDDQISAEDMKVRMLSGELYRPVGEEIAR